MMASVSLAGMSSRRADAAPDIVKSYVRSARTRRANLITIHALAAQCLRDVPQKNSKALTREDGTLDVPHVRFLLCSFGFLAKFQRMRMVVLRSTTPCAPVAESQPIPSISRANL